MNDQQMPERRIAGRELSDTLIRLGLIALLAYLCLRVIEPFMSLLLWGLILAVALYPLNLAVSRRLGGGQGRSATLIVGLGLLMLGLPLTILGASFAEHLQSVYHAFETDAIHIRPPPPSIAGWPLIGKQVHATWSDIATDLPAYALAHKAQLRELAMQVLSIAANTAGSVVVFLGSLIVAGIMMAFGAEGGAALGRVFTRLFARPYDPTRGARLQRLATQTMRSVGTGVVGVALIQALLLGVGFIIAGIPAAGVLAFVVLLIGIAQLPALLVSLPAIAWIWWAGDGSAGSNIAFTIYLLLAGTADNVLKPMLLGRGVDAPMPVVLLGALGGMVSGGIIGLFLGAVVLAVGYEIFMEWVEITAAGTASAPTASTDDQLSD